MRYDPALFLGKLSVIDRVPISWLSKFNLSTTLSTEFGDKRNSLLFFRCYGIVTSKYRAAKLRIRTYSVLMIDQAREIFTLLIDHEGTEGNDGLWRQIHRR